MTQAMSSRHALTLVCVGPDNSIKASVTVNGCRVINTVEIGSTSKAIFAGRSQGDRHLHSRERVKIIHSNVVGGEKRKGSMYYNVYHLSAH